MCTYSAIMDNQKKVWQTPGNPLYPYTVPPTTTPIMPYPAVPAAPFPTYVYPATPPGVSQAEFNKLKAELEELKTLLKAAKVFDEKTGQVDCEAEDKVELLKRVANALGVDIRDAL